MTHFAVEGESELDQFCEDLSRLVSVNSLSELTWHAGCPFVVRDLDAGTLMISQKKAFAENTAVTLGVFSGRKAPLPTGLSLEE